MHKVNISRYHPIKTAVVDKENHVAHRQQACGEKPATRSRFGKGYAKHVHHQKVADDDCYIKNQKLEKVLKKASEPSFNYTLYYCVISKKQT